MESPRDCAAAIKASGLVIRRGNWYVLPFVFLAVAGIFAPLSSMFGRNPTEFVRYALPIGFVLTFAVASRLAFSSVCCYRSGVCFQAPFRGRCYPYDKLMALTFGPLRDTTNKPFRRRVLIELDAPSGRPGDRISFVDDKFQNAAKLYSLRNTIAAAMGQVQFKRVLAGGRANWSGPLCFEGDRMIFDFAGDEETSVEVRGIEYLQFDGEDVFVFVYGRHSPLAQLNTCARNFYTGLFCLKLLREHFGDTPLFSIEDDGTLTAKSKPLPPNIGAAQ